MCVDIESDNGAARHTRHIIPCSARLVQSTVIAKRPSTNPVRPARIGLTLRVYRGSDVDEVSTERRARRGPPTACVCDGAAR